MQLIFDMMQQMSSTENENNGVNGTGSSNGEGVSLGRSSTVEQRGPGRQQATARRKWTTQDNVCVMKCYYMSDPDKRGYRKQMYSIWRTEGSFEATEQRIVDQVKNIQKKGWLSKLQLEVIKRDLTKLNNDTNRSSSGDVVNEANSVVNEANLEISEEEHMLGQQREVNQETERADTVSYPDELEEDQREILGRIKKLMNEENLETPMNLRKFDRMKVKEKALIIDKVLQQVETGNITDTNKLIKVGALVTQELLGVKRSSANEKKHEPYWRRRIENSINSLRKDLSQIQRRDQGKLRREGEMKRLERKI